MPRPVAATAGTHFLDHASALAGYRGSRLVRGEHPVRRPAGRHDAERLLLPVARLQGTPALHRPRRRLDLDGVPRLLRLRRALPGDQRRRRAPADRRPLAARPGLRPGLPQVLAHRPGRRTQARHRRRQRRHHRLGARVQRLAGHLRLRPSPGDRRLRAAARTCCPIARAPVPRLGQAVQRRPRPVLVGAGVGRHGVLRLLLRVVRPVPRRRRVPPDAQLLPVRRRRRDQPHRRLGRRPPARHRVRPARRRAQDRAAEMAVGPATRLLLRHGPRRQPEPPAVRQPRADRLPAVDVRRRPAGRQLGVVPAARPRRVRERLRPDHRRAPQPVVHEGRRRLLPLGRAELALRHLADPDRPRQPARRLPGARLGVQRGLRRGAGHLRPDPDQERQALRRRGARPRPRHLDLRRPEPQRGLQPLDLHRPGPVRTDRPAPANRRHARRPAAHTVHMGPLRRRERALPRARRHRAVGPRRQALRPGRRDAALRRRPARPELRDAAEHHHRRRPRRCSPGPTTWSTTPPTRCAPATRGRSRPTPGPTTTRGTPSTARSGTTRFPRTRGGPTTRRRTRTTSTASTSAHPPRSATSAGTATTTAAESSPPRPTPCSTGPARPGRRSPAKSASSRARRATASTASPSPP